MATDTGSNYWLIGGGGESPAPPSTPPAAPVFGPVTASGYAIAPVDPLSYYNPAPITPEPPSYTGAPTKWYEVYRPTPESSPTPPIIDVPTRDLSNVGSFTPLPEQPTVGSGGGGGSSQPATPSPSGQGTQTPYSADEVFPGFEGLRLGDPVPGMPGTRVGDPLIDDAGNQWDWRTGTWTLVNTGGGTPGGPPYKNEDGATVYPGGVSLVSPPERIPTITLPSTAVTSTPTSQPPAGPQFEDRVTITKPTFPEFQFTEPDPSRQPITLPSTSVISRTIGTTPAPTLPTVPTEITRKTPAYRTGFQYINYDPEEILAAAMRSMGGSRARQSIAEEAQIFNRMRNR